MKAIRKFLADTADLVLLGLKLLGASGPRWEFRRLALRQRRAQTVRQRAQLARRALDRARAPAGARQQRPLVLANDRLRRRRRQQL